MSGAGAFEQFGFGHHEYRVHGRPEWADHSGKSAEKSEQQARSAFVKLRREIEGKGHSKVTHELLKPSCHLTAACWSSFSKYVRKHQGWSVKRRAASEREKVLHKETRKGKVYFVDVSFTPQKKAQKKIAPLAARKSASTKRARSEEEFNGEDFDGGTIVQAQEDDGTWRDCTVYRRKGSDSVVLFFGGSEYEGLTEHYKESSGGLITDSDGDEVKTRSCSKSDDLAGEPNTSDVFVIRFSRTTVMEDWDQNMFVDCNEDECEAAQDDQIKAMRRYDQKNATVDELDISLLPVSLPSQDAFHSAEEANKCAFRIAALALKQARAGNNDMELAYSDKRRYGSRAVIPLPVEALGPDEELSDEQCAMRQGCATYCAKVALFVDTYGDLYNLALSEIKVSVHQLSSREVEVGNYTFAQPKKTAHKSKRGQKAVGLQRQK